MSLALLLLILAAVLFGVAAFTGVPRVNLVAAGLACLTAALIAERIGGG